MRAAFGAKLEFALKALSMSRGRLAADLCVDKSVVGRWVTGAVQPSGHNLARLTAFMATRAPGFTNLDWDRDLDGLAEALGVQRPLARAPGPVGLPLRILDQIFATTQVRGDAYEGLFRSTRPFAAEPGRFIHDHGLIRRDDNGLLRLCMRTGGVVVDGWMAPLQNQIFCVGSELTTGTLVFGIFNGSGATKVEVIDGLVLSSILDAGRTPTASAMIFERVGDLSGDAAIDDARLAELAAPDPVAPEGSVSEDLRNHLARDIGPAQLAIGGDWLLRMPVARSMAR